MHETQFQNGGCCERCSVSDGRLGSVHSSKFPVFKATLREVKLQWDEETTIHVFDAFACDCYLLDHHLPAIAVIHFNYENAFIIEVRNDFVHKAQYNDGLHMRD